ERHVVGAGEIERKRAGERAQRPRPVELQLLFFLVVPAERESSRGNAELVDARERLGGGTLRHSGRGLTALLAERGAHLPDLLVAGQRHRVRRRHWRRREQREEEEHGATISERPRRPECQETRRTAPGSTVNVAGSRPTSSPSASTGIASSESAGSSRTERADATRVPFRFTCDPSYIDPLRSTKSVSE